MWGEYERQRSLKNFFVTLLQHPQEIPISRRGLASTRTVQILVSSTPLLSWETQATAMKQEAQKPLVSRWLT